MCVDGWVGVCVKERERGMSEKMYFACLSYVFQDPYDVFRVLKFSRVAIQSQHTI